MTVGNAKSLIWQIWLMQHCRELGPLSSPDILAMLYSLLLLSNYPRTDTSTACRQNPAAIFSQRYVLTWHKSLNQSANITELILLRIPSKVYFFWRRVFPCSVVLKQLCNVEGFFFWWTAVLSLDSHSLSHAFLWWCLAFSCCIILC